MTGAAPITPPVSLPTVSVVVPHFGDLPSLARCLDALERQTLSPDRFEVIVADNGSPEGPAAVEAVIAGRARLTIVTERGAGPARNGGAHAARGAVLAFTDCDCRPEPGWLSAGLHALLGNPVVGGKMIVLVPDPARPTPAEAFELVFAFDNESYVRKKGFTVSANLFCARAVFDRVGGFGVGVSEDVDWCRRATAAGFSLGYESGAIVGHPARRDWPELVRKARRIDAESYGLMKNERFGRIRWLTRSLALPASALVHAPKVLASDRLPSAAARAGALAMLFRMRAWRFWDSLRLGLTGA
jgi:glycosyltransferase involved in cell wall biosynthesis